MTEVYCGPAPTPATLAGAWTFDPIALLLCAGLIGVYWRFGRQGGISPLFIAIAVLVVLFLSPLCALSAALFSARALHHLLLVAVAAPLLALAFPVVRWTRALGMGWIAAIHALIFWFWHVPAIYEAALASALTYWLMQASLLGTAFWLWQRVFDERENAMNVVFVLLATVVQMGMLGALLTFASEPFYGPHLLTTIPFGLSPVQDQQLAGIVMWVPAAIPYLAAALFRAWPLLGSDGRSAPWSG